MEPSNLLVVGLGVGTVFLGLVSLIIICNIMSAVCKLFVKETANCCGSVCSYCGRNRNRS